MAGKRQPVPSVPVVVALLLQDRQLKNHGHVLFCYGMGLHSFFAGMMLVGPY